MPLVVIVIGLVGLVPVRFMGWAQGLGELSTMLVAPVSHPLSRAGAWMSRAQTADDRSRQEAMLEEDRDRWKTLYQREQDENRRLRERIRDLQAGLAVAAPVGVRQITAPVVGRSASLSSDAMTIRAGKRSGVTEGSVAVVGGVQLVGRVDEVGERVSRVIPLTDRGAGIVQGVVLLEVDGSRTVACSLSAGEDGTLRGLLGALVNHSSGRSPTPLNEGEIAPGQEVRVLDSEGWPASAQMLVIGTVVEVRPVPDSPLRREVVVKPAVELSRIAEVVVRIPLGADEQNDGEGGG